jgi:hypothetical protein
MPSSKNPRIPHEKETRQITPTKKTEIKMTQQNPKVDEYIAKSPDFAQPILMHLRKLLASNLPQVNRGD